MLRGEIYASAFEEPKSGEAVMFTLALILFLSWVVKEGSLG
jgi:hypothetical protein